MTTLTEVLDFVGSHASADDLERIRLASSARTQHLRHLRAASIGINTPVSLVNIKPKGLAGLTGLVQSIEGTHAVVLLDERSTNLLRLSRLKYARHVPADAYRYALEGIPLTAMQPQ